MCLPIIYPLKVIISAFARAAKQQNNTPVLMRPSAREASCMTTVITTPTTSEPTNRKSSCKSVGYFFDEYGTYGTYHWNSRCR